VRLHLPKKAVWGVRGSGKGKGGGPATSKRRHQKTTNFPIITTEIALVGTKAKRGSPWGKPKNHLL